MAPHGIRICRVMHTKVKEFQAALNVVWLISCCIDCLAEKTPTHTFNQGPSRHPLLVDVVEKGCQSRSSKSDDKMYWYKFMSCRTEPAWMGTIPRSVQLTRRTQTDTIRFYWPTMDKNINTPFAHLFLSLPCILFDISFLYLIYKLRYTFFIPLPVTDCQFCFTIYPNVG